MEPIAITMMLLGFACTWGGAIFCIRRAMKAR